MGNQGSQLGDEPSGGGDGGIVNQKNLRHFDHTFKGELHTTSGDYLVSVFGECKFAKREISLNCKGTSLEIVEEIGLKSKKTLDIMYQHITTISWDHNNSEVKFDLKRSNDDSAFVILTVANSVELEGELKLRLAIPGVRPPTIMYVGMFAGESKPKPFQRKRPNLSRLPIGKLPPLHEMREQALQLHRGSYKPCAPGVSRRLDLAVQHIHEGFNSFGVVRVRGVPGIANQWRPESVVQIREDVLIFKPFGASSPNSIDFKYEDIMDWRIEDNEHLRPADSGIELQLTAGGAIFFIFPHLRDAVHTFEYFWNRFQTAAGRPVKLGTTHGRPLVTITTLSGEVPATECPQGQTEVVDQDGLVVRPGGKMVPRARPMSMALSGGSKEIKTVPLENRNVRGHWPKVVMHQGWLLKKGGLGVGSAKSWIKRYFVLYKTSQGHFLVYYADFTECPLFSTDKGYRNVVDLAKCTFIRPGSIRSGPDTPPNSFDIVTTEREWTLCAETQDNAQRWLILLTRAVDEDVAVLPDEELVFKVKPKVDPLGLMSATDYSTSLHVSAHGISVCIPDVNGKSTSISTTGERELFFWVYTDFYKWSLLSQNGKLALLVNVFADASFSRRNEFIFRNKEAARLATSIEYFIEKFMCVMHVRLETKEGVFDDLPPSPVSDAQSPVPTSSMPIGMHGTVEEDPPHVDEVDLLDLDVGGLSIQSGGPKKSSNDPFSGDPFGDDDDADYDAPSNLITRSLLDDDDDLLPPSPVAAPSSPKRKNSSQPSLSTIDPFSSDPFGSNSDQLIAAPSSPNPVSGAALPKIAPPLSPAQQAQHALWFKALMARHTGTFYDDGALQIALTVEVRGSQGRVIFYFRNQSPATITNLSLVVNDTSGLTRFELGPGPTSLSALDNSGAQQVLRLECMKPVPGGPSVTISYVDSLLGRRTEDLFLPIAVTTFNDPLTLTGMDFTARWDSLVAPGLQAQEIFYPSTRIVPSEILAGLSSALHFGPVTGVAGESEFVIHGVASLRTGTLAPSGEKISIGCLAKVEMNVQTNAMRVTVRTLHPAATAALMAAARAILG